MTTKELINTKGWKLFAEWYKPQYASYRMFLWDFEAFTYLPFEFQEGVLRRFVMETKGSIPISMHQDYPKYTEAMIFIFYEILKDME